MREWAFALFGGVSDKNLGKQACHDNGFENPWENELFVLRLMEHTVLRAESACSFHTHTHTHTHRAHHTAQTPHATHTHTTPRCTRRTLHAPCTGHAHTVHTPHARHTHHARHATRRTSKTHTQSDRDSQTQTNKTHTHTTVFEVEMRMKHAFPLQSGRFPFLPSKHRHAHTHTLTRTHSHATPLLPASPSIPSRLPRLLPPPTETQEQHDTRIDKRTPPPNTDTVSSPDCISLTNVSSKGASLKQKACCGVVFNFCGMSKST